MLSTQIPITFEEMEMINRVLIGCTKVVYRYRGPESQWCKLVRRTINPSKEQLVKVFLYDKLSTAYFSPKDIESKFSEQVEQVDHATVSRSLKKFARVRVLQSSNERQQRPRPGKKKWNDKINPGPTSIYTTTENEAILRKFVSKLGPRGIIYGHLYESDILTEYLKFYYFSYMIYCKYTDVKNVARSWKAKFVMDTKLLQETTSRHLLNQKFVRQRSDKDLMKIATQLAKADLIKRNWEDDKLYTEFFIEGGRCYPVIEASNL